jgi:hypothetical protein
MIHKVEELFDKAIQLELNMAKLYRIFAEHFDEDKVFWSRLESEEQNHAALLRTGSDFARINRLPEKIFPEQTESLDESIRFVQKCIVDFIAEPQRQLAFKMAIELEESAGEAHFQKFMESTARESLTAIFQKLNQADKDHAIRIQNYWENIDRRGS